MKIDTPGTFEKMRIVDTRIEKHTDDTEIIVIRLTYEETDVEAPDIPVISDFLYTTNKAWDYTEQRLKNYGWDPVANDFAISFFAKPDNDLIGTLVGPVVLKRDTYTKRDGSQGSSIKVARVGDEKFGKALGDEAAKLAENDFRRRMRMRMTAANAKAVDSLPSVPPQRPMAQPVEEPTF